MKKKFLFIPVVLFISLFFVSCEREISFENGGVPGVVTGGGTTGGSAQYSFTGGTSSCTGASLSGSFTAGTAATATNTVALEVTVDSIGSYIVTTGTVDGIKFSGSGNFTVTGAQTITLTASGTPTNAGTFNFTLANGCTFSVIVAAAPVTNVTGDFRAKIEGTQWVADKIAQGARMNGIINITGLGLDKKAITITVSDSGVHQYTLAWDNSSNSAGAFTDSNLTNVTAFTSNAGSSPSDCGGVLNITSIDDVNKKMSGTFSFKAIRQTTGETRNITEGSFTNISYITSLTGNTSNSMSVKVDGALFSPPVVTGVVVFGSITITGTTSGADRSVAVSFPETVTTGIHTIGTIGDSYYGAYNPNNDPLQATISNSGSLEILEINTTTRRVKGKFSFTSSPLLGGTTFTLSEGVFDTSY